MARAAAVGRGVSVALEVAVSHTRGPLDVRVWVDGQYGCIVYEIENVAETEEQARANAVLFSAAPDLLAALVVAKGTIEIACGTTAPYVRVALDIISAAVAKAEGQ